MRSVALLLLAICLGCARSPEEPRVIGGPRIPITARDFEPAWSPDGRTIAYMHVAGDIEELARGRYQVWLYDVATNTTSYVAPGSDPSWSPAGDTLVFISSHRVFAYGMTTHVFTPMVEMGEITAASWSPAAPMLAITTDYGTPVGAFHIWIVPLDGRPSRDISLIDNEGSWHEPRFSPDGRQLAHERFLLSTPGTELFTMDTTGASVRRLSWDTEYQKDPGWSPTGAEIAYTHVLAGQPEVWIMNLDGSAKRRVLSNAKEPSWSPDGTRLAVARFTADTSSLWIVNADGSEATPLPGLRGVNARSVRDARLTRHSSLR